MSKLCLHEKYIPLEHKEALCGIYGVPTYFWRIAKNNDHSPWVVVTCEDCGENVRNLWLTRREG